MNTMDLQSRPIHHRLEGQVRAHIFLCMLAYYVQWHMMDAWRELLIVDEEQRARATRDPVAPANRSAGASDKAQKHAPEGAATVRSFHTLLSDLGTIVRNQCRVPSADPNASPPGNHDNPQRATGTSLRVTRQHNGVGSTAHYRIFRVCCKEKDYCSFTSTRSG